MCHINIQPTPTYTFTHVHAHTQRPLGTESELTIDHERATLIEEACEVSRNSIHAYITSWVGSAVGLSSSAYSCPNPISQDKLSTLRPEKGGLPRKSLTQFTTSSADMWGCLISPLRNHIFQETSEQATVSWALHPFSNSVSIFIFSLANMINRLDSLERPKGDKRPCVRNPGSPTLSLC